MSQPTDDTTPLAPAAAPAPSHLRTILEVAGGVVAAGLVVVAGIGGFALGSLSSDSPDGPRAERLVLGGPRFPGGPPLFGGEGQRHGHDRGHGQRPGMPGPQPAMPPLPTAPDQGVPPSPPPSPAG